MTIRWLLTATLLATGACGGDKASDVPAINTESAAIAEAEADITAAEAAAR